MLIKEIHVLFGSGGQSPALVLGIEIIPVCISNIPGSNICPDRGRK